MTTTRERYLEWRDRSSLPRLPMELWAEIFSHLNVCDLFSIRLVSRSFHACVNQHTHFWSSIILDIDQCPISWRAPNTIHFIRSSNIDLLTKTNIYAHCQLYLRPSSTIKNRKRRLLIFDQEKSIQSLRCSSVNLESLRFFDRQQLEDLLTKKIRRLELTYSCSSNEPTLNFLSKLERLKYLSISFVHNIIELDPFSIGLINTMRDTLVFILQLRRLKTLTLYNLYLIGFLPDNVYAIEHLRSIWLEDSNNVHFLLSEIDKSHLKALVVRHSTCALDPLLTFVDQLHTLQYLDLASLQIIHSTVNNSKKFSFPETLRTCSIHGSLMRFYSLQSSQSLRSLELINADIDMISIVLASCQSLQILCLFFPTPSTSSTTPSVIDYLKQNPSFRLLIHLHQIPIYDSEKLPSNIVSISTNSSSCFCYRTIL